MIPGQEAKQDIGKPRPSVLDPEIINAAVGLAEYEVKEETAKAPKLLRKITTKEGKHRAVFECPFCGSEFEAHMSNVLSGRQRSCGCAKGKLAVETRGSHGASKTRLYRIWAHIKERCGSPNCKEYKWYGGRGIKNEFKSFEEFRDYAIEHGYNDSLTVERIDVNGNYAPGNVTFIPQKYQTRNTRSNVRITYKGITLCAAEWAEILGINANTLTKRIRKGWTHERTIETGVTKQDFPLVPVELLRAVQSIRVFGTEKYGGDPDNWKRVDPEKFHDALLRHVLASWVDWKKVDPESGMPHLWHIATNAAFLCAFLSGEDGDGP